MIKIVETSVSIKVYVLGIHLLIMSPNVVQMWYKRTKLLDRRIRSITAYSAPYPTLRPGSGTYVQPDCMSDVT